MATTQQLQNLQYTITVNTSGLQQAQQQTQQSMNQMQQSAQRTGRSFRQNLGDGVKKATAPAMAALGGIAAGAMMTGKAAEEAKQAQDRLANVMDQMGYGEATARVDEYANALANQTGVEDETIRLVQAKMATFSELGKTADQAGGAFDRATQATLDMAAAGFGTAEGNAVQLGKALQDPVKGVTALAKSGITFSEAEKKKMKDLVASGKSAEAQEMILAAVEKQVKGTAEATKTATGEMARQWGEVQESIGAALLPVFKKLADIAGKFGAWASENTGTIQIFAGVIGGLAAAILVVRGAMMVWQAATAVATAVQWAFNTALLANPITWIVVAIVALVAAIVIAYKKSETFRNMVNGLGRALKKAFLGAVEWAKKAIDWIKQNWKKLATILGGPFVWLTVAVVKNWDKIKGVVRNVLNWFVNVGKRMAAPFVKAFDAIIGVVKGAINAIVGFYNSIDPSLHISIPSWVPGGFGGKTWGFDDLVPDLNIPMLANGGIVTKPTLAVIGEAGPEAVVPLNKSRGMGQMNVTQNFYIDGSKDPARTANATVDAQDAFFKDVLAGARGY